LVEIILFIVDSGCSKHMTGNLKLLSNIVEQFLGMLKFEYDQIASILGYGDLVQGNVTIKWVYYIEGLNHNLFSVGQFCDADLEVAFWKSTCYIRDLKGNDLLICSRGTDLYYITLQDTSAPNPICLMAKASSSQAWLSHHRLSHLNFDTINLISKYDIVTGPPKLKFVKDHLCSSCELGKVKHPDLYLQYKMSGEEPAPQMAPVESPQMISTVKLPMLKKGEYTLWSMRMEQYLTNTDYGLWQVIMNGDEPVQTTKDENGVETEVPPKTAQAILARQKERKAKSILLLAIPDEYQLRFHTIKDAKSLWAAIKSRFGGNVKSKKMQKNVLKQQFENFYVSDTEGLDKAYDRFQKLICQLEIHSAAVSNKDANQKFLRALPSSWNNIALIMRNKEGIDELDIDDLYNNLKVFEADIKGSSGSSSNSHNVAFLSAEDTNSINEVNIANGVSTAAGHSSQGQSSSSSYTNDLMFLFFVDQSSGLQLNDEDLEQLDQDNLEEMDIK
ncbi:ribonuclease H-like domain-containing protein, partial [Tanacetum coccineum]